ncbi:MAG: acyl carrier protein [bacterium]
METSKKIREYIESNLVVFDEDPTFSDSDNIFAMGFVNSLFAMKLLNFIENEFDIKVDNEDIVISNFSSVNNIMKLIEKKKGVMAI